MNWNNGVPANVTIHYAGNQGGEDPDEPGTDPDEPGTIDKADIYDALSYVVNTATTYAVMPSLLPGLSKNPNDSTAMEYTLILNEVELTDSVGTGYPIVAYGTIDVDLNAGTRNVKFTDGTTINGEPHTASWFVDGGNTQDIIIDGSSYVYNPSPF